MRNGVVRFALAIIAFGAPVRGLRAGTVTFGATCESFGCPPGSYVSANFAGAQGFGPIYFVDSYQFPVNGGSITFSSSSATSGSCTGFPAICTYGFGDGGTFSITGSVFGLPQGSMLISGTFLAGGRGVGEPYGASFNSDLYASYINPSILENLGFPSDATFGKGKLNAYDSGGFPWSVTLGVTPSTAPEPKPALLLGSGLLMLAACRWAVSRL